MTEAERDIVGAFQEWQAIEDEKAELSERSKELFAALKAKGYDTKATRAVFRDKRKELLADPAEVQETEAIYDLYWTALNNGLSEPRARPASARVENIEEFPPRDGVYTHEVCFDAETGEITEQPVTANQSAADSRVRGATGVQRKTEPQTSAPAESVSDEISVPHSNPQEPTSSPVKADKGEADTSSHPASPAPFTNPRCQKPDTCKWAHSMASCSRCNDAWARATVAA